MDISPVDSGATWRVEGVPGWTTDYRIVSAYAWLPLRIDGRWRWRVRHFALQAMHDEESPPAFWLTVARSTDPATLVLESLH